MLIQCGDRVSFIIRPWTSSRNENAWLSAYRRRFYTLYFLQIYNHVSAFVFLSGCMNMCVER